MVRHHLVPRRVLFDPVGVSGAPRNPPSERQTIVNFKTGENREIYDKWDAEKPGGSLDQEWTGKTIFKLDEGGLSDGTEGDEESEVTRIFPEERGETLLLNQETLSGTFPRYPTIVMLRGDLGEEDATGAPAAPTRPLSISRRYPIRPTAGAPEGPEDPRAPVRTDILPWKILHVHDERGENFVVQYQIPVECKDGVWRKRIFYRCRPQKVSKDSEEGKAGHAKAERQAWAHVQNVLESGGTPQNVIEEHGRG